MIALARRSFARAYRGWLLPAVTGALAILVQLASAQPVNQPLTPRGAALRQHSLDVLVARCGSGSFAEREAAMVHLLRRVDYNDVSALASEMPRVRGTRARAAIARVLGRVGTPGAEATLIEAMVRDDSPHVRRAAAHALGDLRSKGAVEALTDALLTDPDAAVRKRAAASLGDIGGAEARRVLQAAARDPRQRWDVRAAAEWLVEHPHQGGLTIARAMPGQVTKGTYRGTDYLLYVPRSFRRQEVYELLVAVHATGGHPQSIMELCIQDAERRNLVVLAPHFDWPTFPRYGYLNAFWDEDRADQRLLEILDLDVGPRVNLYEGFYLYGQGQGGAFAHRFALAHPHRVHRVAVSSCSSFLALDERVPFPLGMGANPIAADLPAVWFDDCLGVPMSLLVGEREPARLLEPARAFAERARQMAADRDVHSRIVLQILPGMGGDRARHYKAASAFLFMGVEQPIPPDPHGEQQQRKRPAADTASLVCSEAMPSSAISP